MWRLHCVDSLAPRGPNATHLLFRNEILQKKFHLIIFLKIIGKIVQQSNLIKWWVQSMQFFQMFLQTNFGNLVNRQVMMHKPNININACKTWTYWSTIWLKLFVHCTKYRNKWLTIFLCSSTIEFSKRQCYFLQNSNFNSSHTHFYTTFSVQKLKGSSIILAQTKLV